MSNIPLASTANNASISLQRQKVELAQQEIKALGKSGMTPQEKAKKLREQCEGFESIFIQKMWQQMRATLPQENPLVGREEKFWQSMYDTELSKKMTEGGGIGLADMMYEQLSQNLMAASRTTAEGAARANSGGIALNPIKNGLGSSKGFAIAPAPFMPSPLANLDKLDKKTETNIQDDLLAEKPKGPASTTPLYEEIAQTSANVSGQNPASQAVAPQPVPTAPTKMQTQIIRNSGSQDNSALQDFITGLQSQQAAQQASAAPNATVVQQFLTGLQSKGQMNGLQAMTGPERAQQAQTAASTNPPAQGVLPPSHTQAQQQPQQGGITRTTFTTNIPKNERRGDTEKLVRQALMTNAMSQPNPQANVQANVQANAALKMTQAPRVQHMTAAQAAHNTQGQAQQMTAMPITTANTATPMTPSSATTIAPTAPAAPVVAPVVSPAAQASTGLGQHFMPPPSTVPPQTNNKEEV